MKIIMAVNAGSSSLKFQLLEMPNEKVITSGIVERIYTSSACYKVKYNGEAFTGNLPEENDHAVAVQTILDILLEKKIVNSLEDIAGVGHRIVQGGSYFSDSAVINEDVIAKIEELAPLAPLHNPAHLVGIRAVQKALPNVPGVAVFDTAFHLTMKADAYMYGTPYEWMTEYKVRKYGAHGTSHKYVANVCAEVMGKPIEELKIITCHIGNGASITAVDGGKCVDTTMGLTPLDGIPMGTRSGNLDPAVLQYMSKQAGYSIDEMLQILNKESGYLGISGVSNDSRDLEEQMATNERCRLALDLQFKRIADYIGSYYVYMKGVDAIVFTAGIGENSKNMRKSVLDRVSVLGVKVDEEANNCRGVLREISTKDSIVKAFIIPTDEEVMIARDVMRLTQK